MKRLTQTLLCVVMATVALVGMSAREAAAKNGVPLKGVIQAVEESFALFPPDVPVPTLFVEGSGSGRATQLGRYAVSYELEVNLDTFFGIGVAEFIAANGDRIFTEVEGQGTTPAADGVSFIVETHTIVGGTGRFDDASGSFTVERVINVFTGVTYGSFEGTIHKQ